MTTEHDTTSGAGMLHPTQTLDAAKRAAAILQAPPVKVAEDEGETVYMDDGAGLVFGLNSDSTFTMAGLERTGRPLLTLSAAETRALYRFWLPICAQAVMERITVAVAERKGEAQAKEEVAVMLDERAQARRQQRVIDIAVAPNCQPDVLSYPPRVVTAPDGSQRLQMRNDAGWDLEEEYPVVEVTRSQGQGLVLVDIGEQAIIMSAADFDTPAA